MPESIVLFQDNAEVQADDFNNLQSYIGQSIDDIVQDAIDAGNAYTGLAMSQTAQTQITIQPGRLYWGGAVYTVTTPTVIDFYNNLPVSQQKQCAVTAWGQTIQTDVQPRNFIIDADTGQSQPQSVAMEQSRVLQLSSIAGVESPQPSYPSIPTTVLLVGYVLLGPSGIVSYQQVTATQLANLTVIAEEVAALEAFEALVEGQISTLATALAALAAELSTFVLKTDFLKLVTIVNQLWAMVMQLMAAVPPWVPCGSDYFLDTAQSLTAGNVDGAYNALINEGLRFNAGSTTVLAPGLALLNPSDPTVSKGSDNFILPTPSGSRVRMDCSFFNYSWLIDRILQYQYRTDNWRQLTRSRHRHCSGPHFTPCPQSQIWYYQAQVDPSTHILSFASESWEVLQWAQIALHDTDHSVDWPEHHSDRKQYWWHDCVDQPYWAKVSVSGNNSGNYIAQTFLNAQDGWLTGISLFSSQLYYQPLTLVLFACNPTGTPDFTQVVQQVTLTGAQLQGCYNAPFHHGDVDVDSSWWDRSRDSRCPVNVYHVRIQIPPTFLAAGCRYGFQVISTYDHRFHYSDQFACFGSHQGAYWVSGSSGCQQWTTGNKSLRFQLHYAVWQQWDGQNSSTTPGPVTVNFQPLQQAGGISSVAVLTESIIPAATTLTYQVQIGGNWFSFLADPNSPGFAGSPALLPFRCIMTGTTDMMPGLNLTNSQTTLYGGLATTFHHISQPITFANSFNQFEVVCNMNSFVAAHQTLSCSLHYGSTHNTSPSVSSVTNADGTIQRTWVWTGLTLNNTVPVTIELDGTQDNTGDPFHVAQRSCFAHA